MPEGHRPRICIALLLFLITIMMIALIVKHHQLRSAVRAAAAMRPSRERFRTPATAATTTRGPAATFPGVRLAPIGRRKRKILKSLPPPGRRRLLGPW